MRYIPYRYYNYIRNCGDAVTSYIIRNNFGVDGRVVDADQRHLLAIGSIFFMANQQSLFWGCGILSPSNNLPAFGSTHIRALRGRKTRDHLHGLGIKVPDVPLGDAGILVDQCLKEFKPSRRYRVAVVPHHSAWHSGLYDRFRGSEEVCLVDMMDDTLHPVEQIASADVVVSQSLHGLIFAEALGKPSLWISNNSNPSWCFKFEDWFTTTANPQLAPTPIATPVEGMIRLAELRHCCIERDALVAAFPTDLIEEDDLPSQEDFEALRMSPPRWIDAGARPALAPDASPAAVRQLTDLLRRLRLQAFAAAAEPGYLAVGHGEPPPVEALLDGRRYLDMNRNAAFLYYGETATGANFKMSPAPLAQAGLPPGCILLRPSGPISGASGFATTA